MHMYETFDILLSLSLSLSLGEELIDGSTFVPLAVFSALNVKYNLLYV